MCATNHPITTERMSRMFAFARTHQQQAETAGDELRFWQWEAIINQLLDRLDTRRPAEAQTSPAGRPQRPRWWR